MVPTERNGDSTSLSFKIVSGGQTGVDRGALTAAAELKISAGGWCPKGRRAEDGKIPQHFNLKETPDSDYRVRTEWNVRDSDGTLILHEGELFGGTALTCEFARHYGRPCLEVNLRGPADPRAVLEWIRRSQIRILNIAGPRESDCPRISDRTRAFVSIVIQLFQGKASEDLSAH